MKKYLYIIIALIIVMTLNSFEIVYAQGDLNSNLKAKVVEKGAIEQVKQDDGTTKEVQKVKLRILDGEYKDEEYDTEYILKENIDNENNKVELKDGEKILVNIEEKDGEVNLVSIQEVVRQNDNIYILLISLALMVIIGRKKGVKLLLVFLVTILSVYIIFSLSIVKEFNLILMTVIVSLVLINITAIIINGLNKKAFIVSIGTIGGIFISFIVAYVFLNITKISGQIFDISICNNSMNIRELLYSGIIVSSVGICLSVANSIIEYLDNKKQEEKNRTKKELLKYGMDKGMDIISRMINMPVIIYLFGAVILVATIKSNINIINLINSEFFSVIILYLCIVIIGSIMTVVFTILAYTMLNKDKTICKTKSDNIIEGQRSLKL